MSTQFSEEEEKWVEIGTKTIYLHNYMKEQIRARYAFVNKESLGLSNIIMDSYVPSLMYKHNMPDDLLELNIGGTSVAISAMNARLLGIKQVEVEQLCRVLGYTKANIKQLMTEVKRKNYNFAFIGAGGTGVNTAHWLSEMSKMTNTIGLFQRTFVYDNDDIEISNLFRFPVDVLTYGNKSAKKINLMKPMCKRLSKLKPEYAEHRVVDEETSIIKQYPLELFHETIDENNNEKYETREKTILYGAPDLETREKLSKTGSFISATHSDASCNIYLNPSQDLSIQVESYGTIQLTPFFMNQLRMAIKLLEILADPDFNPSEKDKELFNYSFNGERVLSTDRTYQFYIQDEVRMLSEEESNNL